MGKFSPVSKKSKERRMSPKNKLNGRVKKVGGNKRKKSSMGLGGYSFFFQKSAKIVQTWFTKAKEIGRVLISPFLLEQRVEKIEKKVTLISKRQVSIIKELRKHREAIMTMSNDAARMSEQQEQLQRGASKFEVAITKNSNAIKKNCDTIEDIQADTIKLLEASSQQDARTPTKSKSKKRSKSPRFTPDDAESSRYHPYMTRSRKKSTKKGTSPKRSARKPVPLFAVPTTPAPASTQRPTPASPEVVNEIAKNLIEPELTKKAEVPASEMLATPKPKAPTAEVRKVTGSVLRAVKLKKVSPQKALTPSKMRAENFFFHALKAKFHSQSHISSQEEDAWSPGAVSIRKIGEDY